MGKACSWTKRSIFARSSINESMWLELGSMASAWQILIRGGVPLAAEREGPPVSAAALGEAVRAVLASPTPPAGREQEALAAFLLAWRKEWPTTFASVFGDDAEDLAAWARFSIPDPNRYLKLRRIAVANLAEIL